MSSQSSSPVSPRNVEPLRERVTIVSGPGPKREPDPGPGGTKRTTRFTSFVVKTS